MRMRKKKNLLPRMERCGDRLIQNPYDRLGHWRDLMPEAREIHLELGCGKGRFTAGTAAADPDVLLIAVEIVPDAMVVAMERCVSAGLKNVFFIDANADQLPYFFAPGEIDRIYLNFSDPWPPKGQHKRRLTHPAFLSVYQRFLREKGEICFKTDNRPLFEHSICYLSQFGYGLFDVTFDLHATDTPNVMTEYERNFSMQGMPIYRLVARKMLADTPRTDVRKIGQYDAHDEDEITEE